ncbi:MAG: AMP-binding protein, partial [Robiginitomaculum sp.]|nr:AMP-binding protein [Robiginitomaculum sp.]
VKGLTDSPLYEGTIGDALHEAAKRWPEKVALVSHHQNLRLSYTELLVQSQHFALGLLALGLKPGDRVGIWAPNCTEWTITQFATALAGLILVNINPDYRPRELEYALDKVGCKALVLAEKSKHADYVKMVNNLTSEGQIPSLEERVLIGNNAPQGYTSFGDLIQSGSQKDANQLSQIQRTLSCHDPINIQFTSGTTGAPKGATLTHNNILNNALFTGQAQNLGPDDKLCIPVPLYHCFGMVMGSLACCLHGSTAIYASEKFDAGAVLDTLAREKCTAVYGVPTMFIAMLDHPNFSSFDLASLRTGVMAGSPCPIEVMKRVISDMNMDEVTIGYGMTETSPISFQTSKDDPLDKRVSTVGRVHPHVEVKVIDKNGNITKRGVKGELCTRGYSVMKGYWNDEEKTAEAIDKDGWMHTGDLAVIDNEGYCDIVGRVKDMLIRGGENIFPREIEDFLFAHKDIAEAQVFGVPDAKYGEEVCAWIRLKPGAKLTNADIKAYCKDEISHFKIPRHIRFVDEFPMTVTGKIKKNVMRKEMSEELNL